MNKTTMLKWLPGFLIYISLAGVMHAYLGFHMLTPYRFLLATVLYSLVCLCTRFKKAFLIILAVAVMFTGTVLVADAILTAYTGMYQENVQVDHEHKALLPDAHEGQRHKVASLHRLRDTMDIQHAIRFMTWALQDRFQAQDLREPQEHYEVIFFTLLHMTLACVLLSLYKHAWLKPFLFFPLAMYVWLWYRYVDLSWYIYVIYFGGMLGFFIMESYEHVVESYKGFETRYYKRPRLILWMATYVMGFIILTNTVFWLVPFQTLNRVVDAVIPNLWGARSGYDMEGFRMYALRDTPYQNNEERLGGPTGPINNETPLFWLEMTHTATDAVYLKATIKETYDGRQWYNETQSYRNRFSFYKAEDRHIQAMENPACIGRITFDQLSTITLLAPVGLYGTSLDEQRLYVSLDNEAFYKAGAFVKHLKTYDFYATGKDFNVDESIDYLQIPPSVDKDVIALSQKMATYTENDYDTMRMLTHFLNQNYTYELSVRTPPRHVDFVSYFILDAPSGYCTYFASALTIMARANGIPARYVEGFLVQEVTTDTAIKVTEAMAHAWTEAYIDGRGWVVFEPTPPFNQSQVSTQSFTPQDLLSDASDSVIESITRDVTPEELDDFLMEADGGITRSEANLQLPAEEAQMPRARDQWAIGLALAAVFMLGLLALIHPGMAHLSQRLNHKDVVRQLKFLAYLIQQHQEMKAYNPQEQYRVAGIDHESMLQWLALLYGPLSSQSQAVDQHLARDIHRHVQIHRTRYVRRFGWFAYLWLRVFKVRRMIP